MTVSPYIRRLREHIGHELLLMPAVAVLVWDAHGRLLLVREAQTGLWQTIGGSIEPDESPHEAALREAQEEAGVTVRLRGIRAALGGPQFRLTYPHGDEVSYVSIVFDAELASGTPRPDGEETTAVAWFTADELAGAPLTPFTVALLDAAGAAGGGGRRGL